MRKKELLVCLAACMFLVSAKNALAGENNGLKGITIGVELEVDYVPGIDGVKLTVVDEEYSSEFGDFSYKYEIETNILYGARAFIIGGFTDNLGIEASFAYLEGSDDTNLMIGKLGAVAMINTSGGFRPRLNAGVVYGEFDVTDGRLQNVTYDGDFGYEGGVGVEIGGDTIAWMFDINGRYLKNDAAAPEDDGDDYKLWDDDDIPIDEINLSSVSISTGLVIKF